MKLVQHARRVYGRMPRLWRSIFRELRSRHARRRAITALEGQPIASEPHQLPGEFVVSLTSYPPRFPTLHLTLESLLRQNVKPDRFVLWIAESDLDLLPEEVLALQSRGLEVRSCDDLRSYKKLVPALEAFGEAFIATVDDDVYYPPRWLKMLTSAYSEAGTIICSRARRLAFDANGSIARYLDWDPVVVDAKSSKPSIDLVPVGVGGVLYPPNSLHPDVTDRTLFQGLCPDGDDLWFYWCARRAGSKVRRVGPPLRLVTWKGSQDETLWDANRMGGNDEMVARLKAEYGQGLPQQDSRVDD